MMSDPGKKENMRNPSDLIGELNQTAEADPDLQVVALVVGFETRCEFVFSSDAAPLKKLNGLILKGGEPIGLCAVKRTPGENSVLMRPLSEYAGDKHTNEVLSQLTQVFASLASGQTSA